MTSVAGARQAFVAVAATGEPQRVPVSDLERIEGVTELLLAGKFDSARRFDLRSFATLLATEQKRTGVLGGARVDLLPHQILTAVKVLEGASPSHLLADDVGLGKTIEVGMVLSALAARGEAERVLILTPAGLTIQWQEQMDELFGLWFDVFKRDFFDTRADAWSRFPKVIASLDAVKRKQRRSFLEDAEDWDVLIVDEAHRLTARRDSRGYEEKTQNYELVHRIRDKFATILFATGTPHQGDDERFALLLRLLRPDLFEKAADLSSRSHRLREVMTRNRKSEVTDDKGRFLFQEPRTIAVDVTPSKSERDFLENLELYIKTCFGQADSEDGSRARVIGFVLTTFGKLAASSPVAIHRALSNRLAALKGERKAEKASRGVSDSDHRFEGEYEEAAAPTAAGAFFEEEVSVLSDLVSVAAGLGEGTKAAAFIERLNLIRGEDAFSGGVLVFTEYRGTQEMLVRLLQEGHPGTDVHVINGGQSLDEKRAAVAAFDERGGFLVSTEAGGEGLNLHRNCHVMFNFDLPWNPMRLAQRIGRLNRYGQQRQVIVLNLHARGGTDDLIRTYLAQKIESVMATLAAVQDDPEDLRSTILGEVESEIDLGTVYIKSLTSPDPLARSKSEIDKAMRRVRAAAEHTTKIFDSLDRFELDEYVEARPEIGPEQLQEFVRLFLAQHGRRLMKGDSDGVYTFKTPEPLLGTRHVKRRYERVTFDPEVQRVSSDHDLMAFGQPAFDRMLELATEHSFGGYAAARDVVLPGHNPEVVLQMNYVVSVEGSAGRRERFVSLVVDGDGSIRPELAEPLRDTYSSGEPSELPSDAWLQSAMNAATEQAEVSAEQLRLGAEDELVDVHLVCAAVVRIAVSRPRPTTKEADGNVGQA